MGLEHLSHLRRIQGARNGCLPPESPVSTVRLLLLFLRTDLVVSALGSRTRAIGVRGSEMVSTEADNSDPSSWWIRETDENVTRGVFFKSLDMN